MEHISFEWDKQKNISNKDKHGVSFEEAKTVFLDENAIQFYDDNNSEMEDRFLLLGRSFHFRMLMVCHCVREKDSIIRIISARKATKNEQKYYKGQNYER